MLGEEGQRQLSLTQPATHTAASSRGSNKLRLCAPQREKENNKINIRIINYFNINKKLHKTEKQQEKTKQKQTKTKNKMSKCTKFQNACNLNN